VTSDVYWRLWRVTSGWLVSPFAASTWPADRPVTAWSDHGHASPPAEGCECGIRGMTGGDTQGPKNVIASAVMAGWIDLRTWQVPPFVTVTVRPLMAAHLTLAIGRVALTGRTAGPSPCDPAPIIRAEHGQACGTLYVTTHRINDHSAFARNGVPSLARISQDDRLNGLGERYGLPVRPVADLCAALIGGKAPE
jgi:hypothetical protein